MRKYVVLFGSLFSSVYLDRDDSTGATVKTLKVPLSFGPKEQYVAMLKQNPDKFRQIDTVLPRMAFDFKSLAYDGDRKLASTGRFRAKQDDHSYLGVYNPVPYNIGIELVVMARNFDDANRIVEQIVPFFKPEWSSQVELMPELGFTTDIAIVLNSVSMVDTYEGSMVGQRPYVMWSLGFTLKGYLYGPVKKDAVIREVDMQYFIPNGSNTDIDSAVGNTQVLETVTLTPGLTANGEPTSNASLSIPKEDINDDDPYGFIVDYVTNL